MARRIGWLTGIAVLVLTIVRLARLLQPPLDGPPWPLVLLAAAALGAVLTWVAVSTAVERRRIIALHAVGLAVVVLRVAAADTLALGVVPTGATLDALGSQATLAVEILRFGAAPVLAVPGLTALLTVVYWLLGTGVVVGVVTGRRWLIGMPGLAFYLQLAILDRRSPGTEWLVAFAVTAALVAFTMATTGDPTAGRMRARTGLLVPRVSMSAALTVLAIAIVASVYGAQRFAATVPEAGTLNWRTQSGIGSGLYGGTSFNLFVGLQQNLLSLSEEELFVASLSESAPPNDELYWRLVTLDVFDGENWIPGGQSFAPRGDSRYEREDMLFQGPTTAMAARVRIAGLTQQLLPVLYSPTAVRSEESFIADTFRVREDGAVGIDVRTKPGWEYEIEADIPRPDIAQLASLGGELSPIFAEAADRGAFAATPRQPVFTDRPENIDDFLSLPEGTSRELRAFTRELVADGITRFEQALILEAWFRDSNEFTYSTEVSTGHSSLDLAEWILDPSSPNYRSGYCEQFATAMAVMARTMGLPSRVVLGFTPGDVDTQADGSRVVVVRERNAHAWVELWMDGQGWVRFDPTPRSDGANPALTADGVGFDPRAYIPVPDDPATVDSGGGTPGEREGLQPEIDITTGDATPDLIPDAETPTPTWVWWLVGTTALVGAVPGAKWIRRRRRLTRIGAGDVEAAWEEIVDRLIDLRESVPSHLTPLEIAQRHSHHLQPLARLYTEHVYGDPDRPTTGNGRERAAFGEADIHLDVTYPRAARMVAAVRPNSLVRR